MSIALGAARRGGGLRARVWKERWLFIMLLPGLLYSVNMDRLPQGFELYNARGQLCRSSAAGELNRHASSSSGRL